MNRIEKIIKETRSALGKTYGERMRKLILFGSHSRGEATEESDIDLAVILDDFDEAWNEIKRSGPAISDICLRNDVVISIVPIRERDYLTANTPLLLNLRREGAPV